MQDSESLRRTESPLAVRKLKIEADGDFWKGLMKPKIRLMGRWLARAGFQPGIRIRAQKGGKEVMLPLMDSVGDALVGYLRHRHDKTPFREVFLTTKAPVRPLTSGGISNIVRGYMRKVGITLAGGGSRTLRHSWAIRALANDSPIKAIADVLGHRYIDTTFIYAKADLNTLREVAMPWPEKG